MSVPVNTQEAAALKLDIGSGMRKRNGFIAVDVSQGALVDVRADLEKGLPFKDDTFSEVWMNHVFEHLTDPVAAMDEIWRVCKHGARVEIRGPHFSMPSLVWGDPTHKRGLSLTTFQYFDGSCHYAKAKFRIESCLLQKSNTSFKECGWKVWYWPFVLPNALLQGIINSSTSWVSRYERSVSRFVGFHEIRVVMSPHKEVAP